MKELFEKLCNTCTHKNCCTDSAVPLVFLKDLEKIRKEKQQYQDYLSIKEINGKKIKTIKKKANSKECVFWDSKTGGCSIYKSRPIDCKLYPFDLLEIHGKYHWIVYSCNESSDWTWTEEHLKELENDSAFESLMENIEEFSEHTKMILPDESEKTPYTILRKVNWQKQ